MLSVENETFTLTYTSVNTQITCRSLSPALSGLLWHRSRTVIQLFSYLRGYPRVNGWNGKDGDLKGYKKRGEVSFSHGVMKHFITAFFPPPDSAAPLTLSTSHFVTAKLCERRKKKTCNTAVFKQTPQTLVFSQHFVTKLSLYANLGSILFWWKKKQQFSLAVCCCLHCVLVFNSFIIKGFSLPAPCWTLSCNAGINWSAEISACNYVLSPAHYLTHRYTHADRVWMQKDIKSVTQILARNTNFFNMHMYCP